MPDAADPIGVVTAHPFGIVIYPRAKRSRMKPYAHLAVLAVIIVLVVGTGCVSTKSVDDPIPAPDPTATTAKEVATTQPTQTLTKTPTTAPTPTKTQMADTATMGEKNAATKALSYLKFSAFSREGLIDQLEFEGFTRKEAVYGVDQSGADWNEQAAKKAASYLKYSSFSRSGLIDQLEFEGFTHPQAEYGVKAVGY